MRDNGRVHTRAQLGLECDKNSSELETVRAYGAFILSKFNITN